ncbi:unnamed protein product [Candidula unifasciata]|uniref:RING finger protein 141 n=1 Tax=Candidula unifasciata TaxID=100452 RepID=A0A8S3Z459_9EUPU|nr:unnamed protein product [Candidula unifasciata]
MGQSPSTSSASEGDLGHLHSKLMAHFDIIKSLATVTHAELVECIEELNMVTRSFTDKAGKQLRFIIKKGSDTTFLWKGNHQDTLFEESSRLLTLRQFVVIYNEILEQVSTLSSPPQETSTESYPSQKPSASSRQELTASAFFPHPDKTDNDEEDSENECCVCMDRKACIMLSCCHEFCEACIDSWTKDQQHSNCPLCRSRVSGADDTWVLTAKTDPGDYASELKGYLVGIADRVDDTQS